MSLLLKLRQILINLHTKIFRRSRKPILPKDKLGKDGEIRAALFLKKNGYKIVGRNVRFTIGEIDIIAKTGRVLVFVEVKTRRSADYCHPIEVVDRKKRERIKKMVFRYFYLKKYDPETWAIRFDIITLIWPGWPEEKEPLLEHFVSAFE